MRNATFFVAGLLLLSSPSTARAQPGHTSTSSTAHRWRFEQATDGELLDVDPATSVALLAGAGGFGLLSELILGTGEIRPQEPGDPSVLLSIDRPIAESTEVEDSAGMLSDVALGIGVAYALVDISLTEFLDRPDSFWSYLTVYAETAAFNWAIGNITKIAVRRPRPIAYFTYQTTGEVSQETNSALSFYSLHTSMVAGLTTTATYLSFARGESDVEPWIILGTGAALTTFVGWQRVRAHAHFPTDVIAGALAGSAVGFLVPHLNRREDFVLVPFTDGVSTAGLGVTGRF